MAALKREELATIGRGPQADRLKLIRLLAKRTQRQVGELIGYSQQMVAEFERGASTPSPSAVGTLCEKLAGVEDLAAMSEDDLVEFAYGRGVLALTAASNDGGVAPTGFEPAVAA